MRKDGAISARRSSGTLGGIGGACLGSTVRIVSELEPDVVLRSIGELLEKGARFSNIRSGLVGRILDNRVSLAYRVSIVIPRLKVASFVGRVTPGEPNGSVIAGVVELQIAAFLIWIFMLLWSAVFVVHALIAGNLGQLFGAIALGSLFLFCGPRILSSTRRDLIDAVCGATRGRADLAGGEGRK